MLLRALSTTVLMLAAIAAVAWAISYIRPLPALLLQSKPDRAVFLASTDGRLVIWAQQIAPPAPAGGSVNLATPYRVQVSYRSPGQSSSFNSSFGTNWLRESPGWHMRRNSSGVISVGDTMYSFTVMLQWLLIPW